MHAPTNSIATPAGLARWRNPTSASSGWRRPLETNVRRRIAGALLIIVAGLAVEPATGSAKATGPGTYTVIPKVAYPGKKPGGPFVGHMVRGQTFIVTRLSPSGTWAYGHGVGRASYLHGWVRSVALKPRATG